MPRNTSLSGPAHAARLLACLAFVGVCVVADAAHAQCPETTLQFPYLGTLTVATPTFDVNSPDTGWIRGDHHTGEFSLHHCGSLSPTVCRALDRYDVTGVPPGTLVPVTVRLSIDAFAETGGCGGSGCCGFLRATVRAGRDTATAAGVGQTFGGRAGFQLDVEVPITMIAGTPREIEIEMYSRRCAGGAHTVDGTGRLEFVGTDPDAAVKSCKGFGPYAVPVRGFSWGSLKTLYR